MGFFKNIGNAVKKGLKQVSLKNVVKLGTPLLSMIPVVGSVAQGVVENASAAAEAKKQARIAEEQGRIAEAEALHVQADILAAQAGAAVGQQAGSVIKAFSKGVTQEVVAQTSQTAKEVAGNVGAEIADQSIIAWFKKHMTALLIGGAAIIGLVVWKKKQGSKPRAKSRNR
jgi:hypothetical protein